MVNPGHLLCSRLVQKETKERKTHAQISEMAVHKILFYSYSPLSGFMTLFNLLSHVKPVNRLRKVTYFVAPQSSSILLGLWLWTS